MAKNHGLHLLAIRAGAQERGEGQYVGPCLRCGTGGFAIGSSGFDCSWCSWYGSIRDLEVFLDSRPPRGARRTDLGLAERLVERYGHDIRFAPGIGWFVWDGRRWTMDNSGALMRFTQAAARSIWEDGLRETDHDRRKALVSWAATSESHSRLVAAEKLARSQLKVVIAVGDLDATPYDLNCLNGTVDLRTAKLRGHRRSDLITKLAPVEYDPSAEAPRWHRFLQRVLPDPEVREYVQKVMGYSVSGMVREHLLILIIGSGANGKSVFLGAMHQLLGDYARTAEPGLLLAHRSDRHPTGLAALLGARFVSTSEPDSGKPLAEAVVKQLTGGDRVTARRMRQDFFEFSPTWTIWMAANHRPEIRGTDDGIWRRVKVIPFDVSIPIDEQDRHLSEKLGCEMAGIMSWIVEGAVRYLAEGLRREPSAVQLAVEEYRNDSDALGRFFEERCGLSPTFSVPAADLYDAWREWCEESGELSGSASAFGRLMTNRHFRRSRSRSSRRYAGIRLQSPDERSRA